MRALVTGAAGFIGSHLVDRLLEDGAEVIGVDCLTPYYPTALKLRNLDEARRNPRFVFLQGRVEDIVPNAPWLPKLTHVFHLAGQPGVRPSWGRDFDQYVECNITPTQRLLEACSGLPLGRFVYASTSAVYGNAQELPLRESSRPQPVSPYGVTKLAGEHLCQLYASERGLPVVTLRYFTVYGPRQRPDMAFARFFAALRSGSSIPVYGTGAQVRDFTYVGDIVRATVHAAAFGAPRAIYNICGGSAVSLCEAISTIAAVAQTKVRISTHPAQPGEMHSTVADYSAAARDIGYRPSMPFAEGLRRQYAALPPTEVQ